MTADGIVASNVKSTLTPKAKTPASLPGFCISWIALSGWT
jgi:hypothetical protein